MPRKHSPRAAPYPSQDGATPSFLDHQTYGFRDEDLNRKFFMGAAAIGAASAGVLAAGKPQTLREILETLRVSPRSGWGLDRRAVLTARKWKKGSVLIETEQ